MNIQTIKAAILRILNPRTVGIFPDTLKKEVLMEVRDVAVGTADIDLAIAELKSAGLVKSTVNVLGDLTIIATDAGRAALAAKEN